MIGDRVGECGSHGRQIHGKKRLKAPNVYMLSDQHLA